MAELMRRRPAHGGLPAQTIHQRIAVDARNGRLAGRIDIGHDHRPGVVHAGAEILEK
jgi:hypothetical protein